ncbi:MAG TPA: alpha/beta hydrolase [Pararobbsia sp.]|nr:alpha/beta hydrolase [Pararobbsia sp.]
MSTWILLRGLTREARHWGEFPAQFGRIAGLTTNSDSIVTIELPGNGHAHAARSPADVAQFVASVRAAAASQGLMPPYRVLAMSLGGMVATSWAQHYPDEIERLVLINTSMRPFCRITQRLRVGAWPRVIWIIANWHRPHTCERAIHALTCAVSEQGHDERDIDRWADIRRTHPVSAHNGLRQLYAAARFEAAPAAPRCPTLLLSSAADRLVDPVCSARIASQWGADHLEHAHANHDLPHDDPVWTSESVRNWLASVDQERKEIAVSAA